MMVESLKALKQNLSIHKLNFFSLVINKNLKIRRYDLRMYVCTVSLNFFLNQTGCHEYQEENAMKILFSVYTHSAVRDIGNCQLQKSSS